MRTLAIALLAGALALAVGPAAAQPEPALSPKPATPFPAAGNDDVWAKLPRENPPLPEWARILAGPLPRTTAKMLELDYLHREKNPFGAELAAVLRWTVADALGSKFGIATAEADLKRAGLPAKYLANIGNRTDLQTDVRVAVAFARKLTTEGHAITDKEFAELLKHYGPEKTTAIVHTVAYANFHNRVVLALGAAGDPVPPVDAKFDADKLAKVAAPPRPPWDDLKSVTANGLSVRVEWGKDGFDELNAALEKQKDRKYRMPLPDKSVYDKLTPREKESAEKIRWNTVSMGYQPEMTRAWFAVLYAFYDEAKVDRVFTKSVFWVVTRTNDCFY
jgi:alkylhydroperoxidase family enzyme